MSAAEVVNFLSSHYESTESWKIWKGLITKTLVYITCPFRFFVLRRVKVVPSVSCFDTDAVSRCCFVVYSLSKQFQIFRIIKASDTFLGD